MRRMSLSRRTLIALAGTSPVLFAAPSARSADKVLKMHYYAAAGIAWYLLVDQETGALHLYRLSGDRYLEHSVTEVGQVLRLGEPVEASIAPEDLLPPG